MILQWLLLVIISNHYGLKGKDSLREKISLSLCCTLCSLPHDYLTSDYILLLLFLVLRIWMEKKAEVSLLPVTQLRSHMGRVEHEWMNADWNVDYNRIDTVHFWLRPNNHLRATVKFMASAQVSIQGQWKISAQSVPHPLHFKGGGGSHTKNFAFWRFMSHAVIFFTYCGV